MTFFSSSYISMMQFWLTIMTPSLPEIMGVFMGGFAGSTPKWICPCRKSLKMHNNRPKINGNPKSSLFYGYATAAWLHLRSFNLLYIFTWTYNIDCLLFQDQPKLQKHSFEEGWVLEAVHPRTLSTIHPATVKRIVNEYFFVVELILTDEPEPIQFSCHSGSANVFPVGWCLANNVTLYGMCWLDVF